MIVAGLRFDTSGRTDSGSRWQKDMRETVNAPLAVRGDRLQSSLTVDFQTCRVSTNLDHREFSQGICRFCL